MEKFRITGISNDHNLFSKLCIEILNKNFEKVNIKVEEEFKSFEGLDMVKSEIISDYFIFKDIKFRVNITQSHLHLFTDNGISNGIIKDILKLLNKTTLFSRYGIEVKQKVSEIEKSNLDKLLDISDYLPNLRGKLSNGYANVLYDDYIYNIISGIEPFVNSNIEYCYYKTYEINTPDNITDNYFKEFMKMFDEIFRNNYEH